MRSLHLALTSVFVVAACGDDIHPAASDAPGAPDTPVQPVTLIATIGGVGVADVPVYFQNADSSLVSATKTDATGRASAVMSAGGFVTAIDPFRGPATVLPSDEVYTYAGVKPGDVLRLAVPGDSIQVNVVVPSAHSERVWYYRISTSCGEALQPASELTTVLWLNGCNGIADILVVTEDSDFLPVGYFYMPDTAVADQATLDFSEASYSTDLATRSYTFNNVAPYTVLVVNDLSVTARGSLYLARVVGSTGSDTSVTMAMAFPRPPGATEIVQTELEPELFSHQYLLDWGSYDTPFAVDVGARTMATFTDNPTIDTSGMTVPDSGGMAAEVGFAEVSIARPATPPYDRTWHWYLAAPYASTQTLPVLPSNAGFDYNIKSTDAPQIREWLAMKVPGGYDAVRANLLGWHRIQMLGEDTATSPSGSATIQAWEPLPTVR